MCMFKTRIRGVSVGGRSVYLSDHGLRLSWRGPEVEVERFLADLDKVIAATIREAIPHILAHHARKAEEARLAEEGARWLEAAPDAAPGQAPTLLRLPSLPDNPA